MFSNREELSQDFKEFMDSIAGLALTADQINEAMKYLENGANPYIQDCMGQTLLHKLILNNKNGENNQIIQDLIYSHPETLKIKSNDKQGLTPIHLLAHSGSENKFNTQILSHLLQINENNPLSNNQAILNLKNNAGETVLGYVLGLASEKNETDINNINHETLIEISMMLVAAGANPNTQAQVKNANPLLHLLVINNKDKKFTTYIEDLVRIYGADVNIKNCDNLSPLDLLMAKSASKCTISLEHEKLGKINNLNYIIDPSFDSKTAVQLVRLNAYIFRASDRPFSDALSDYVKKHCEEKNNSNLPQEQMIYSLNLLNISSLNFIEKEDRDTIEKIAETRAKAIFEKITNELKKNNYFEIASLYYQSNKNDLKFRKIENKSYIIPSFIDEQLGYISQHRAAFNYNIFSISHMVYIYEKSMYRYKSLLENSVAFCDYIKKTSDPEKYYFKDTSLNESKFLSEQQKIQELQTTNKNSSRSTNHISEIQAQKILMRIRKIIKTYNFETSLTDTLGSKISNFISEGKTVGGKMISWDDKEKGKQEKLVPARVALLWQNIELARNKKLTCLQALLEIKEIGEIASGLISDADGLYQTTTNVIALEFYKTIVKNINKINEKQKLSQTNVNTLRSTSSYVNATNKYNGNTSTMSSLPGLSRNNFNFLDSTATNSNTNNTSTLNTSTFFYANANSNNNINTSISTTCTTTTSTMNNNARTDTINDSKTSAQNSSQFFPTNAIDCNANAASVATQYGQETSPALSSAPPSSFICPISLQVMTDPVIVSTTGNTYDRHSIEQWWTSKGSKSEPITNVVQENAVLIPNRALKNTIDEWKKINNGYKNHLEYDTEQKHVPVFMSNEKKFNSM
jgi:hypothetical protein